MKILIITPSLNIHGGIRVLVEWANHLARRDHEVTLQIENGPLIPPNDWIEIDSEVQRLPGMQWNTILYDVAVAGTPFIALRMDRQTGAKKFFLLQMAEDLFSPGNTGYVQQCRQSYRVNMPIIGISKWVEEYVRQQGRTGPMYYIGNGVSQHFQPGPKDSELTILAEGWEGYNPAKDEEQITARVAETLKKEYNARIIAFSQFPMTHHQRVPDEYHTAPGTDEIRRLYQRAHLMIKATRYDARSCAPVEAMACGTVTARGLVKGDDDLKHQYNCLRGGYNYDEVLSHARRLIEDTELRQSLVKNGLEYRRKKLSWEYWMDEAEKLFEND